MPDDIVERLNIFLESRFPGDAYGPIHKAAEIITALRRERAALVEALKLIAAGCDHCIGTGWIEVGIAKGRCPHCYCATQALAKVNHENENESR